MLRMKRGDTKPDLVFEQVRDQDGELIELSTKTVHVVCRRKSVFMFSREVQGVLGSATMLWEPGDTDVVGRLKFELKIALENGHELTIPSEGHFDVEVTQDLDQ